MKDGLKDIVGKQIAAVAVARGERARVREQVFLVFADGTRFEFYGDGFSCCGGVDRAEGIERYVKSGGGEVVRVYGEASAFFHRAVASGRDVPHDPADSIGGRLLRDLQAWLLAKAAIDGARRR